MMLIIEILSSFFSDALCTLAKHWVGVPEDHLSELKGICRRLQCRPSGMAERNRVTLLHFDDDEVLSRLLALPSKILRRYRPTAPKNRCVAIMVQLALAIELLTVAPVRVKNLAAIRIGKNVISTGSGQARRVHLYFAADEVKNAHVLEFPLPPSTVSLLDLYISRVRPHLQRAPSDFLFPGARDGPKGSALLSEQNAGQPHHIFKDQRLPNDLCTRFDDSI